MSRIHFYMKNLSYSFLDRGEVTNQTSAKKKKKKQNSHILQSASCVKFKAQIPTSLLRVGISFISTFILVCLEPLSWIQSSRMFYRKILKQVVADGRDRGSPAPSPKYCTKPASRLQAGTVLSPLTQHEAKSHPTLALSLSYSVSWFHPHLPHFSWYHLNTKRGDGICTSPTNTVE